MTDDNGNHAATPGPHLSVSENAALRAFAERARLKALNAELVEALELAASTLQGVVSSYRDAPPQFNEPLRRVRAVLIKAREQED